MGVDAYLRLGVYYLFLPLELALIRGGANSRLGAYSNKYVNMKPMSGIFKRFLIFLTELDVFQFLLLNLTGRQCMLIRS